MKQRQLKQRRAGFTRGGLQGCYALILRRSLISHRTCRRLPAGERPRYFEMRRLLDLPPSRSIPANLQQVFGGLGAGPCLDSLCVHSDWQAFSKCMLSGWMKTETGLDNCIVKTNRGVTIWPRRGFLAEDFSISISPPASWKC